MYYVVYGLLYLFSLLPLRVLYVFSTLSYWIIYYIMGYRKEIVMSNLQTAFPEKTEEERKAIAKDFYLNFTDTFIETIKMISISKKQVLKRGDCEFEYINELIDKGYNIHILAGHQFNWEFANLVYSMKLKIPFVGLYAPIGSKTLDRVFFKMRSRYGTVMISTKEFTKKMHHVFVEQYMLGLAADQNPSNPANGYWLNFFGKPAPFVKGPGKGAVKNNTAVVFVAFEKTKRGYYAFRVVPITENGSEHTPEELTATYRTLLENAIRKTPSNYLWSHRRWRHEWKEEYGKIEG